MEDRSSTTDFEREFLIREYVSLCDVTRLFFSIRAAILGLAITVIGGALPFVYTAEDPPLLVFDLLIVGIAIVVGRMLAAAVRASYVFQRRMAQIARTLGVLDYWTIWPYYAKRRDCDSGIRPFEIALLSMYLLALAHLIGQLPGALALHFEGARPVFQGLSPIDTLHPAALLLLLGVLTYELCRLHGRASPARFFPTIQETWDLATQDASGGAELES